MRPSERDANIAFSLIGDIERTLGFLLIAFPNGKTGSSPRLHRTLLFL